MTGKWLQIILEFMPILAVLGGLVRWIFQLKDDVKVAHKDAKDAHKRIDALDEKHSKFEDKIDASIRDTNHRIDNCRESILASVNNNMNMLLKALAKG